MLPLRPVGQSATSLRNIPEKVLLIRTLLFYIELILDYFDSLHRCSDSIMYVEICLT